MGRRSSPSVGLGASLTALASPLSLAAIAILLINDHLLKQVWPSFLTGKLSDFAGLYFAPVVFCASALSRWPRSRSSRRARHNLRSTASRSMRLATYTRRSGTRPPTASTLMTSTLTPGARSQRQADSWWPTPADRERFTSSKLGGRHRRSAA